MQYVTQKELKNTAPYFYLEKKKQSSWWWHKHETSEMKVEDAALKSKFIESFGSISYRNMVYTEEEKCETIRIFYKNNRNTSLI